MKNVKKNIVVNTKNERRPSMLSSLISVEVISNHTYLALIFLIIFMGGHFYSTAFKVMFLQLIIVLLHEQINSIIYE